MLVRPTNLEQRYPLPATPLTSQGPCTDGRSDSGNHNKSVTRIPRIKVTPLLRGLGKIRLCLPWQPYPSQHTSSPQTQRLGPTLQKQSAKPNPRSPPFSTIGSRTYQISSDPSPARSYRPSSLERSTVPDRAPGRTRTCTRLPRTCRRRRRADD